MFFFRKKRKKRVIEISWEVAFFSYTRRSSCYYLFFHFFPPAYCSPHVYIRDATWVAWNVDSNSSKSFWLLNNHFIHIRQVCWAGLPANWTFSMVHCRLEAWQRWFESNDIVQKKSVFNVKLFPITLKMLNLVSVGDTMLHNFDSRSTWWARLRQQRGEEVSTMKNFQFSH